MLTFQQRSGGSESGVPTSLGVTKFGGDPISLRSPILSDSAFQKPVQALSTPL